MGTCPARLGSSGWRFCTLADLTAPRDESSVGSRAFQEGLTRTRLWGWCFSSCSGEDPLEVRERPACSAAEVQEEGRGAVPSPGRPSGVLARAEGPSLEKACAMPAAASVGGSPASQLCPPHAEPRPQVLPTARGFLTEWRRLEKLGDLKEKTGAHGSASVRGSGELRAGKVRAETVPSPGSESRERGGPRRTGALGTSQRHRANGAEPSFLVAESPQAGPDVSRTTGQSSVWSEAATEA